MSGSTGKGGVMFISHHDIEKLVDYESDQKVATIYFYDPAEELDRELRMRLKSYVDAVKHELERKGAENISGLLKNLEIVQHEIIKTAVENASSTYCVFIANDFYCIKTIPVHLKEKTVVDTKFYTLPLLMSLDQFERFAILVFSRDQAKMYNYYLGKIEEQQEIFHDYVLENIKPSSATFEGFGDKRVANKIERTYHRHLKEISRILFMRFELYRFDKLLIASHQEDIPVIKRYLHPYLMQRLAGEFVADVNDDMHDIKQRAQKEIETYRHTLEKQKLQSLLDASNHGRGVRDVNAVCDALINDNVREIIVSDDFHTEGYVSDDQLFLSASMPEGETSPYSESNMHKTDFFEEDILEKAFAQGAGIFHVFYEKDAFDSKIGALLRY